MPHISTYVGLADHAEKTLAESLRAVAEGHADVADVYHACQLLAGWSDSHRKKLEPLVEKYGEDDVEEPERLHHDGLAKVREGEVGLVRDLQDLHVLVDLVETTWTVVAQAAQGVRDRDLLQVANECERETGRQKQWLDTRLKQAAPQALVIDPGRP
jgi:hypothetical protein